MLFSSPTAKLTALLIIAGVAVLALANMASAQELRDFTKCGSDPMTCAKTLAAKYGRNIREEHIEALAKTLDGLPPERQKAIVELMARFNEAERMMGKMNKPGNTAPAAKSSGQAQATQAGNSAADIARDQACASIDYASRFLRNFTSEGGNRWNRFRDGVFVPIGILLLLPGAVMTQARAIMAQSNPVLGHVSPIEGISRSLIGVFLIPGSYLIVNYAIDLANSFQYTIAQEYRNMCGTDMYHDAMCAEIRAFAVRYLSENDGSLQTPPPDLAPIHNGIFSRAEGRLWGKLNDPCARLFMVPPNRDDASMPSSTIAARSVLFSTNAATCTGWTICCAFQMAFFYYLFFVGPVFAGLWVWPMKVFRDAFGTWVEGVITLCFWSFFWATTILLIACFKGTDDTGLFMITALNFLATGSVKHAFDFAGLVKAAGMKAAELGEKMGKAASGGK
ncbi:MAG: hypothetical protein K2Y39_07205 [Candidatus Obscuribacterales bacterium]|nr:hypothetical protein [Candidatus Obscuribacterales bacterium]